MPSCRESGKKAGAKEIHVNTYKELMLKAKSGNETTAWCGCLEHT
ncbi:hypothetical protein [Lacrimispora sp.]|nr:hypothetical protein [Lacrimispora sp.]